MRQITEKEKIRRQNAAQERKELREVITNVIGLHTEAQMYMNNAEFIPCSVKLVYEEANFNFWLYHDNAENIPVKQAIDHLEIAQKGYNFVIARLKMHQD